jgi:hypothetical protein
MPRIASLRSSPRKLIGSVLAELLRALADRQFGQHDAASGDQLFEITIPEREPNVQPYGRADNLGGKAMVLIGGEGYPPRLVRAPRIYLLVFRRVHEHYLIGYNGLHEFRVDLQAVSELFVGALVTLHYLYA